MGWINIPQKQWVSGGWVLIHDQANQAGGWFTDWALYIDAATIKYDI